MKSNIKIPLVVSKDLEYKIRILCDQFPSNEWSGVLFYSYTGNIETNTLSIVAEDFCLMALGSSGFTEFNTDVNIASYIADHPETIEMCNGLIHSHNSMAAFFSGTDTSTLNKEGKDTNVFLSLIVNNTGQYVAKVAVHVKINNTVSYIDLDGKTKVKQFDLTDNDDILEYDCDIKVETVTDNVKQALLDRIEELKKTEEVKHTTYSHYNQIKGNPYSRTIWDNTSSYYGTYKDDFNDNDFVSYADNKPKLNSKEVKNYNKVIDQAANKIFKALVNCGLNPVDKRDNGQTYLTNIESSILQDNLDNITDWATSLVSFLIESKTMYITPSDVDPDVMMGEISSAVIDIFKRYKYNGKLVEAYIEILNDYLIA